MRTKQKEDEGGEGTPSVQVFIGILCLVCIGRMVVFCWTGG